jgi:hypothetical protein
MDQEEWLLVKVFKDDMKSLALQLAPAVSK